MDDSCRFFRIYFMMVKFYHFDKIPSFTIKNYYFFIAS
ncbi:hypothetical protein ALO_16477 [Acetonema longum DSM 6540]|uniref:Uncharacterized protein n=1 Tax=Acetonema longum DSM 6540 TaxID=1009370 RepID=F7NMG5_9FIRM|nr:hypothetical protein ALO_16477 [Acetonema longum DSM 6540]